MKLYPRFGKRVFDILGSFIGLIILSPVIVGTAIAVRIKLGKPVFFKHNRPGRYAAPFDLYKFRTMTNARDEEGNLLPDSERITKFGSFLRATSLDEIPELINILKGEMSFVGPRPLLTRYLPFYTATEQRRFEVRPGLTGLAQVNGRNTVRWDNRLSHDIRYVENLSFLLDLKIILNTFQLVWKRQGVVIVPETTMLSLDEERKGSVSEG